MQNPSVLGTQRDAKNDSIFGARREIQAMQETCAELNTITIQTYLVLILLPPLQNSMFSLEKRGFGDDSGDSLDDSPGAKAAHKTTQHLQAWTCMDRQESQRNWPEMLKTLGKPGFLSGEDRNRTFAGFTRVFEEFERCLKMDCYK